MTQQAISPLSMSQTKEELLRHLNMSSHTYDLMAVSSLGVHDLNETAQIYAWIVKELSNFKQSHSTPVPPFDWSDITELAKQHAALELSRRTNLETAPYWQMGETTQHGNNWVSIWFLYHKFRYRDGRNRAKDSKKGTKKHQRSGSDGKKSSIRSSSSHGSASSPSQSSPSARSSVTTQPTYYQPPATYPSPLYSQPAIQQSSYATVVTREYFDPVRNEYTIPH